jgi:hypothetical protein
MAITGAGSISTASYLSNSYSRAGSALMAGTGTSGGGSSSSSSSATLVTLSAAAQAALTQAASADFATVTADARTALDALYKGANVAAPVVDGKQTVDLSALDRRTLYAIASNGGEKFTTDEQTVAANELKARFNAVVSPQAAVARLTGDWSQVYKAALDYMQGAGPEEKASATWKGQVQALQQGYAAAVASPGSPPAAGADDPVAAYLADVGANDDTSGSLRDFSQVANDVRTALNLQQQAANKKGLDLIYSMPRKSGQMADLSGFDNRALSAISLNQGNQFSPQEIRAAKTELDSRTRASLLTALKQSGSSSDPRTFSLALLSNYTQMSPEERQATNFTTDFRDMAVKNYQTTSSLISMLQQAGTGSPSLFG